MYGVCYCCPLRAIDQQSIFTIFSRCSVHDTVIRLIIRENNHVIHPDPRCIVDGEVGEAAKVVGVAHGVVIAGDLISVKHCSRIAIFLQEVCQWSGWHTLCKRYFLFFLCSRSHCREITIAATIDTRV